MNITWTSQKNHVDVIGESHACRMKIIFKSYVTKHFPPNTEVPLFWHNSIFDDCTALKKG